MRALRRSVGWITTVVAVLTMSAPAFAALPLTESLGGGAGEVNWSNGTLTVTGSGAPPDRGSMGERRLLAERAAVIDGYRQLAELIHGVRVDSETVVKDFTIESDTIRTQVNALVRGAQKVDTRYLSDGAVEVDLQVSIYGPSSLFAAIDFNRKIAKPIPGTERKPHTASDPAQPATTAKPTPASTVAAKPAPQPASLPAPDKAVIRNGKGYTGVIIDCRELAMQPAMSPAILDEAGKELYIGKLPIDPDQVIETGLVSYTTALDEAKAAKDRIGDNPLIVKAKKTAGQYKADAILSTLDAQALLDATHGQNFLTRSRVVFILKP